MRKLVSLFNKIELHKMKTGRKVRWGFSLAEAMMATVVLGIAAASVLLPFSSGAAVRAEGMHRTLGARLASDLMEKIVNTPFDQIVGSFNGYTENEGQISDAESQLFTDLGYARFSRSASCAYVYVPQEGGAAAAKFILATVRTYYSGKQVAVINRLISK